MHAWERWVCVMRNEELFSRKLSELGSRLDFGVQGLGRGIGAAAGQKWSFRVRRMSISSHDGVPVLSWQLDFVHRRGTWCVSPSPLSCNSSSFVKDIGKTRIKVIMFRSRSHLLFIWASMFFMRRRGTWCTSPSPLSCNSQGFVQDIGKNRIRIDIL